LFVQIKPESIVKLIIMIRLIVGLGNPGLQYIKNRHNIGFVVLDEIARRLSTSFLVKSNSHLAEARVGSGKIFLLKPQTFMNLSGNAIVPFMRFHKLEPSQVLVIHDDLDLPFGRLRVRTGGSSGGQNGVKHLSEQLGTDGFVRLKIGISRPPKDWSVPNWVLSNFAPEELPMLEKVIKVSADAAEIIAKDGAVEAQNKFNHTDLRPKEEEKQLLAPSA
jgi:peptidyl-tRNA hydrolase, PTH1 family